MTELDYSNLLDLPQELIEDIEEQASNQSSFTYTSFYYNPEQRCLISNWTKNGELGISLPGEPKTPEFGDLPRSDRLIGFKGVIVLSEQQSIMQQFINGKPEIPMCSTVGYKRKAKNYSDGEAYIQKLPSSVPWTGLNTWDNNLKKYVNLPTPQVVENDLLGSKGMRCADCIKQGLNRTQTDENNTVYCKVTAQIVMYVTHVKVRSNNKVSEVAVNKLNSNLPKGIIVTMRLNDSAYKGHWLQDDRRMSGYLGLIKELTNHKGHLRNIYLHQVSIDLIKKQVKRDGKSETSFALLFNSLGLIPAEDSLLKEARTAWNESKIIDESEIKYLDINNYVTSVTQPQTTESGEQLTQTNLNEETPSFRDEDLMSDETNKVNEVEDVEKKANSQEVDFNEEEESLFF